MAEKIKLHDFVEVDYTGKLPEGMVFDTTLEKVAKENDMYSAQMKFSPATVCVGERQVLPGLDQELEGKEIGVEYTVTLPPEKAFGKRDIKRMKIVPAGTFKEHKIDPRPGLQVDIDGEMGIVTHISGGRIIVNFNHPLAGKEVIYTFKINRKIEDNQEKVTAFLSTLLGLPKEKTEVKVVENKATVILPLELPAPVTDLLKKKLVEVTSLTEVVFEKKKEKSEKDSAKINK